MSWLIAMFGGVALLIWGLRMVRTSIERSFPMQARWMIGKIGSNRSTASAAGAALGTAMQSGTAAITLSANMAERNQMTAVIALAMAFGADLGSAIAANILSADVGILSYLLIFIGVLVFLISSSRRWKGLGRGSLGLGLIFLAVGMIGDNASAAQGSQAATVVVGLLGEDPALAFLVGGVLAVGTYSSIAAVIFIGQMAMQGIVGFETAVLLLFGANAGAGFLPLLATLNLSRNGRTVTLANLITRLIFAIGSVIVVNFIGGETLQFVESAGQSLLLLHVMLNGLLVVCCLKLIPTIVATVEAILPVKADDPNLPVRSVYLDEEEVVQPDRALANCTRELLRAGEVVHEMLARSLDAFDREELIGEIRASDESVDSLHSDVTHYISALMRNQLSGQQAHRARELFDFSTNLEHIGDIIDHNLMELARSKTRKGVVFSEEGWNEISRLHAALVGNFRLALDVIVSEDPETAQSLLDEKRRFRVLAMRSQSKHFNRLLEGHSDSIGSSVLHLDILRDLRRISSHLSAAAYPVLDQQRG